VVVMETVGALQKLYQLAPESIVAAPSPLLVHAKVRFDHPDRVHRALTLYGSRSISIVDAYLAAVSAESATSRLATFDRQLQSLVPRSVEP
jgi:predicted nucleic-acid-binding protein